MSRNKWYLKALFISVSFLICNLFSLSAFAADIHVPENYQTIQEAIDAAQTGDVILVADGTYSGTGNDAIDFDGKAITLQSENGPTDCFIDAKNIWGKRISFVSYEDSSSVLSGFTIMNYSYDNDRENTAIYCENSSPTINNCIISGNDCYGIQCTNSSPNITDCTISDNGWHGIYCSNFSSPVISGCTVSNNRNHGIVCVTNSSPTIIDCEFNGNTYPGIYLDNSSPTITSCSISEHGAGNGIVCFNNSCPVITGCTISENVYPGLWCDNSSPTISRCFFSGHRTNVIACYNNSSPTFTNCMIFENSDPYLDYPIVYLADSSPSFMNCTIYERPFAGLDKTGIYCKNSSPEIINSIVWVNLRPTLYLEGTSNPKVSYSLIRMEDSATDPYSGEGNIKDNPGFIDPGDLFHIGNYHLSNGSPCIDAGTDEGGPDIDFDGEERPFGAGYDIGADELVSPYPIANAGDNQTVSEGLQVTLDGSHSYDVSGTIVSYLWEQTEGPHVDLSDVNARQPTFTAPRISNMISLTFQLTVTDNDGNRSTDICKVEIIDIVTAEFNAIITSEFIPLTVNFTDNSRFNITSWSWDFGDGGTSIVKNPSHTYTRAGTYTVSLTVTGSGMSDTQTRTNYIKVDDPIPSADFTASSMIGTEPFNVSFTDLSTGDIISWSWDFGDGGTSNIQNPRHIYNSMGTYPVRLTVSGPNGTDTETKNNFISVTPPIPSADFTASAVTGLSPLSVNFIDLSRGTVISWSWDFGDGGTSKEQNPSHIYSTVGNYTVSLTATGAGGSDTKVKSNYILVASPPVIVFDAGFSASITSGTLPLTVSFTDQSIGNITSRTWDFGDGETSTALNPSHTYNSAKTYTIKLTVTGPLGTNIETKVDYITVTNKIPLPDAGFIASGMIGTAPMSVNFYDQSGGNVTSWTWDFGDGSTSIVKDPSYIYNDIGSYTVKLTVTGPGGADTETKVDFIVVKQAPVNIPPTADAGPDQEVDEGDKVTLDGSGSSDIDGSGLTYSWSQISGTAVTLSDKEAIRPSFVVPELDSGNDVLIFRLTVKDGGGLETSSEVSITVIDIVAEEQSSDDKKWYECFIETANPHSSMFFPVALVLLSGFVSIFVSFREKIKK